MRGVRRGRRWRKSTAPGPSQNSLSPASEPIVSSADTVRVAPDATVTAVVSDRAPPLLFSVNPPAETVVLPV